MKKLIGLMLGGWAALAMGAEAQPSGAEELVQAAFAQPAVRNHPETWFHVIGGNFSKEGLTADLEAIKAAGISGIQFFHGQFGGPWPGVPKQIACLSPEWESMVVFAADECHRLGLTFKMQNCPGWSMSGGPWIPPSKAMRKLTYRRSDVEVASDGRVSVALPPSHDLNHADLDYHDVAVLAFPTPAGDLEAELKPAKSEKNGHVYTYTFERPVLVRTSTVPSPNQLAHSYGYNIKTRVKFEAIADDGTARVLRELEMPQACWQDDVPLSYACDETVSRKWRVTFNCWGGYNINTHWGARLYSTARHDNWEGRAAWTLRELGWEQNPRRNPASFVKSSEILDLSDKMAKDGKLEATLPHGGKWTILRFGNVNMCKRNGPAPKEGTGWECDKLDPKGAEAQYAGYIGRLAKGPLKGKLDGVLFDSWECERQTWTDRLEEYFRKSYGYELRKHFPSVFGWTIDDPAATDKFLLDWRNLLGSLVEENFFHRMADLAHADGLEIQYETAFGDVIPGDIMKFWKYANTPMAEFWRPHDNLTWCGSHDFKPVLPCVSSARLYGKKRVACEAFTNTSIDWRESLGILPYVGNKHFARGVTHCVFHTYTHNPQVNWKKPGTSFGWFIGTPFLRGQTWWPFMPDFTDWLARINYMLETGHAEVDVLRYLGDYVGHKPHERDEPFGNRFKVDYLNPDGLATRVSVKNGRWCYPDGMSYSVLWIPSGTYVSESSAKLIATFEKQGGRVVRGDDPTVGLVPDVTGGDVLWNHHHDGKRDWYFVAAKERPFKGELKFRAKGAAELWNPYTGKVMPATRRGEAVALDLAANEVVFVVFDSAREQVVAGVKPTAVAKLGEWTLQLGQGATGGTPVVPVRDATGGTPVVPVCDATGGTPVVPVGARPLAELEAWCNLDDRSAEERAFSGTGIYRATVTVEKLGTCRLDLGRVEVAAKVFVNGQLAASLWCPPYRCEIGHLLRQGANDLRVEVTSSWHNRLAFDAALPEKDRQTWTICGPGANSPLGASGLLGPVTLTADPETLKAKHRGLPLDRTTKGNWLGKYGSEGYFLVGDRALQNDQLKLPAYVESLTLEKAPGAAANRSIGGDHPRDAESPLVRPWVGGETRSPRPERLDSAYSDLRGALELQVKLRENRPFQMAIYLADCNEGGRETKVVATDAATGRRLASATYVNDFSGGVYVIIAHDRSVKVKLSCAVGNNVVMHGVFFGGEKKWSSDKVNATVGRLNATL